MHFKINDRVRLKNDPQRLGIAEGYGPLHGGVQFYQVFWGGIYGTTMVAEEDLIRDTHNTKPIDNLINGNFANYQSFQRLITLKRLSSKYPLRNNIYAFNASRTRFLPHQFKPLIKMLDSSNHRLLLADEVGLGKTIEAGLILIELQARQTINRVLVVCPAGLREKWQMELKKRFDEDFEILNKAKFINFIERYGEFQDRVSLKGIISFESIRNPEVFMLIQDIAPSFDLVIIDEAHSMRNFFTQIRKVGKELNELSSAMIMLTATPVQLGIDNLYSLLNILDPEDFRDKETARNRFDANTPIVQTQICFGQIPPNLKDAFKFLNQLKNTPWFSNNPLFESVLKRIETFLNSNFNPNNNEHRRWLIELQKDLAELNLIGHIFTRTRKREVLSELVTRKAKACEIHFSEEEMKFYNSVINLIRLESEERGDLRFIQSWKLHTPMRQMASSIPAMVEYYHNRIQYDVEDDLRFNLNEEESDIFLAKEELMNIINNMSFNTKDSKYEKFINALQQLQKEIGTYKVIVFAYFKATLHYLKRKLKQDNIESLLITGDIPPDERNKIINQFRESPNINILLSSRVGSEGLDFQFCNTLVNYDLPWNPMEVEQRIGRLDRIGQESKVVNIINFWVKDTIEERILRRLYERIKIFERSIGGLEVILGEITQKLEKDIFSHILTPEQELERANIALMILEAKIMGIEKLENESAKFIGADQYFNEEVEAIKNRRRYVTGEQLRRFLSDFLKTYAPYTKLNYNQDIKIGRLYPEDDLRKFIQNNNIGNELAYFFQRGGIEITFDSQKAFEKPNIEFINVLHPLIIVITKEYERAEQTNRANCHHVLLKTNSLKSGFYYYFIFHLHINAAKGRNTLEFLILDENLNEVCSPESAEAILGEMVEKGEDPIEMIDPLPRASEAFQKAELLFTEYIQKLRSEIEENNDRFIDRRLTSLNNFYEIKLNKQRDLLKRAMEKEQDERIIRLREGTIRRLESELNAKQNELEKLRKVTVESNEISAGILKVV